MSLVPLQVKIFEKILILLSSCNIFFKVLSNFVNSSPSILEKKLFQILLERKECTEIYHLLSYGRWIQENNDSAQRILHEEVDSLDYASYYIIGKHKYKIFMLIKRFNQYYL